MTRILLLRHGATDWNINKRAQGHADVPLNDVGVLQAKESAERLADVAVDAIYSSDLSRSVDTARTIADVHGLHVAQDPDFREIDQGDWTGLSPEEIRHRWPDKWGEARHYNARPGGETPAEVRARALGALKRVVEAHPDQTVVVVSHAGTIRWVSAEALGYDDRASAGIRGLGNGAIMCLDGEVKDGRLVLTNLQRWDGKTTDLDDPND